MKVLVCGSRDWDDWDAVFLRLWELPPYSTVIHGGARGADQMAARFVRMTCHTEAEFKADWKRHGKRAGPIRNLAMLDERPDLVIAFQRNGSRGTQHTVDEARKRGIPVEVHTGEGLKGPPWCGPFVVPGPRLGSPCE